MNRRTVLEGLVALVIVVVLLAVAVVAIPALVGAEESYVVLSASMQPSIGAGDVVIVDRVPPSDVEAGNVGVFDTDRRRDDAEPGRVTHRVVEVVDRDGSLQFRTKGDANEEADPTLSEASQLLGRVRFTVPYLGYLLTAGTPSLRIGFLVVLPGLALAASGLWTLVRVRDEVGEEGDSGGDDRSDGPKETGPLGDEIGPSSGDPEVEEGEEGEEEGET